jgi:hypothetical protein
VAGPLRLERDGALAVITLDRPEVLNAFDEALTSALALAIDEVAADAAVRAVALEAEWPGHYLPLKLGLRLFTNASTPSFLSSVAKRR